MSAADRYHQAAAAVAVDIDIADKLMTDPTHPGDRSPEADRFRAQLAAANLAEFRAARAALFNGEPEA